jgi:hypothetical protein
MPAPSFAMLICLTRLSSLPGSVVTRERVDIAMSYKVSLASPPPAPMVQPHNDRQDPSATIASCLNHCHRTHSKPPLSIEALLRTTDSTSSQRRVLGPVRSAQRSGLIAGTFSTLTQFRKRITTGAWEFDDTGTSGSTAAAQPFCRCGCVLSETSELLKMPGALREAATEGERWVGRSGIAGVGREVLREALRCEWLRWMLVGYPPWLIGLTGSGSRAACTRANAPTPRFW